jgi:hypothetical protein
MGVIHDNKRPESKHDCLRNMKRARYHYMDQCSVPQWHTGTRKLTIMFIRARHYALSRARWILLSAPRLARLVSSLQIFYLQFLWISSVRSTCPADLFLSDLITLVIDLKGFWRWFMLYRIHRIFLDFFHRPVFKKTRRFGNWICLRSRAKVEEKTPTQLGPLERANLNHWTSDVSSKHSAIS